MSNHQQYPNGYTQQPQPHYVQPVYAQPVAFVPAAEPKGHSITAMIFGLSSILLGWTLIVPILAIVFGVVGLRKEPSGRAFAITGIVSGAITGFFSFGFAALFWIGMVGSAASA